MLGKLVSYYGFLALFSQLVFYKENSNCAGDGSTKPFCNDWVNPDMMGQAFYLPHQYGELELLV